MRIRTNRIFPALLFAVAVTLLATGCAPRGTMITRARVVHIPLRFCHGIPYLEAQVNGRGPYTFFFDSGAGFVTLSADVARELKIRVGDSGRGKDARGEVVAYRTAHVDRLQMAGVELRGIPVSVFDLHLIEAGVGRRVGGLLGVAAFSPPRLVTLDYEAQELILESGELPEPNGRDILETDYQCYSEVPSVTLDFAGQPRRFAIDSGNGCAFEIPEAWCEGLEWHTPPRIRGPTATFGAIGDVSRGKLKGSVHLGQYEIVDPFVSFPGVCGMIGAEILDAFRITFDLKNGRIRLLRNKMTPITFRNARPIGLYPYKPGEVWIIHSVRPGSWSELAGIRAGDELRSINGRPYDDFACSGWSEIFGDAKMLRLSFMRGHDHYEAEMPRCVIDGDCERDAPDSQPATSGPD